MSTPLVVNRVPASGEQAGIDDSARFGTRDTDTEIDRATLQCYLGAGPAFWTSGELPEDNDTILFSLEAFNTATPNAPAVRSLESGGELKLVKSLLTVQEATYFFGGLQSPADPEEPLMLEAELQLSTGDTTPDVNDFTGVAFGLMAGAKGVAVKFLFDGVNHSIEIHDAGRTTIAPPSGTYVVPDSTYAWDGVRSVYKLLWHPLQDQRKGHCPLLLPETAHDRHIL